MIKFANGEAAGLVNPVVTIGSFDGVHIGHREIIERLAAVAKRLGGEPVVLTFAAHPRFVIEPEYKMGILTTNDEKIALLKAFGAEHVLLLEFTNELAAMNAEDFLRTLLIGKLGIKGIIVGYDHVFGHDRKSGMEAIASADIDGGEIYAEKVPPVMVGDRAVSSTRIRRELEAGNADTAAAMLGRPYSISGEVVRGRGIGKTVLGFPTANIVLFDANKIVPANGVYAVKARVDGGEALPAMLNIGNNPTFGGQRRTIEAHIFGINQELYGSSVTVSFYHRLRSEVKFASADELRAKLTEDKQTVSEYFKLLP